MIRFLYIADTHLGAAPMGYQQQKGYPQRLPEILSALCQHLSSDRGVDFVLHGGDMIDVTTDRNILASVNVFDLPVPVYLCLGNHDLTTPDAVERWLTLAPRFFPNGAPDYTVSSEHCVIHVAPNHWCDRPFYWKDKQEARLSEAQIVRLSHALDIAPHLPHLVLTHSPVHGLPTGQTGFPAPYHRPNPSFTAQLHTLVARHPNVKCVLGAHTHMNMRVKQEGVEFITVSALVETPFEFKLFEVTPQRIVMSTLCLNSSLAFSGEYHTARAFVQGRADDRSLYKALGA